VVSNPGFFFNHPFTNLVLISIPITIREPLFFLIFLFYSGFTWHPVAQTDLGR
jgi:hypothetical protein